MIELRPEYLKTLALGKHTITALFDDGSASTEFTILAEGEKPTEEATKDSAEDPTTDPTEKPTEKPADQFPVLPLQTVESGPK